MEMKFYYNETEETIYALLSEPECQESSKGGWQCSIRIEKWIRGKGCKSYFRRESYPDPLDSEQDAIKYFKNQHMCINGAEIDSTRYNSLLTNYRENGSADEF